MASGVPVVSTDVGIVFDVVGPLQSHFVLKSADPVSFANAIEELFRSPDKPTEIGRENRQQVTSQWSWADVTEPWWNFWQAAHERSVEPRYASRRRQVLQQACSVYANYLAATAKQPSRTLGFFRHFHQ